MFLNAIAFNQDISGWQVYNVTNMNSMFQNASKFNQNIGNWNVSKVTTMIYMFYGARAFNNGETGLQNIPNITPSTASYTNNTKTLTCPGATFLTSLLVGDILIIQTSTIVYSSAIQSIASNTSLTLTTAYGSNILTGILFIQKQIPGSSPLNWNTSNVTNLTSMFQEAVFFNQNITTNGNIWNTSNVTNLTSMFQGILTSLISLFNNGQIITGTTAPMGWTFTIAPTRTNYRTNCRLTTSNKPASLD